jgi:hypothetical protein
MSIIALKMSGSTGEGRGESHESFRAVDLQLI